jgi:hypothetical protein
LAGRIAHLLFELSVGGVAVHGLVAFGVAHPLQIAARVE